MLPMGYNKLKVLKGGFVVKAVIFDFDGTLVDTLPVCIEAFKVVFLKYTGSRLTEDEIISQFGPTELGIFKKTMNDQWQEAHQDYLETYASMHNDKLQMEVGLLDFINDLQKKGIRIAIVSGKGAHSMAISLKHFGLESIFEKVITGSDHGADKSKHLKTLLDAWHIKPEDAVYIGDTAYDMKVANALGMIAVGAAWTPGAKVLELMEQKPEVIFTKGTLIKNWFDSYAIRRKKM